MTITGYKSQCPIDGETLSQFKNNERGDPVNWREVRWFEGRCKKCGRVWEFEVIPPHSEFAVRLLTNQNLDVIV